MSLWPTQRLGDLTDILSGFAFDSECFDDSGELPLVRIRNVVTGRSATFFRGNFDPKFIVRDGAVLIGMDGEFNRARWQGGNALLNQRVCRIAAGSPDLDDAYLYYFLPDALKVIEDATPFVTVKHLSVKSLREIKIPLPPLPVQRRIAGVLDRAETLRSKRHAALAQLDSLTQAVFIEMFGDPVGAGGKWLIDSIKNIAADHRHSIVDGPFGSSIKPEDYKESGVPVIRIANITTEGYFLPKKLLYISKSKFQSLRRSSVQPNDVLVSRVGTIGNTCIFPVGVGDALLSTTGVCKITVDTDRMLPLFLHQSLRMPSFQTQIHKSASTSVQKYFNLTALKGWKIIVPPLNLQNEFARRVVAIEKLKTSHRASLSELDALFASLQHQAFWGEL